jgi:hypothetical protein
MQEGIVTLFALLLAAAAPAQAAEPRSTAPMAVTGRTRAPAPEVARSALQEAGAFAARQLKCADLGIAKASLMPKGWVPADPNFRIGPKGARYERWEIEACGRTEPFLVVFWKHKGRPDFQVAHPFPADVGGKPAKR